MLGLFLFLYKGGSMGSDGVRRSKNSQKEDARIAKQLCYPKYVIAKLENEPDPRKRQRILNEARLGKK